MNHKEINGAPETQSRHFSIHTVAQDYYCNDLKDFSGQIEVRLSRSDFASVSFN
jgi:hypothetical protein